MPQSPIRFFQYLAVVSCLIAASLCGPAQALPSFEFGAPAPTKLTAPFQKLTFKIKKLSCPTCANTFVQALGLTGSVRYAKVELHMPADADALVIYNPYMTNRQQILDMLHNFHFQESNVK